MIHQVVCKGTCLPVPYHPGGYLMIRKGGTAGYLIP
jgi:hypothetical protein